MSLSSRSRQRCAGRGQCALGLQARGLKIPCAPSPEACGRYRSRSPKVPPWGQWPGRAAGRARERRTACASAVWGARVEFKSGLCPSRTQQPPLPSSYLTSGSLRVPRPQTTAIQIYNPNNLISRSSPPASALALPHPTPSSLSPISSVAAGGKLRTASRGVCLGRGVVRRLSLRFLSAFGAGKAGCLYRAPSRLHPGASRSANKRQPGNSDRHPSSPRLPRPMSAGEAAWLRRRQSPRRR